MSLKTRLTAIVIGLVMAGAPAYTITEQFLKEKEGLRLNAYRDGMGKPTICMGHTEGVYMGMVATPQQCAEWAEQDMGPAIRRVEELSPVALSEPAKAGIASFCFFNLGETKCHWTRDKNGVRRPTKFWSYWMAGDMQRACDAIPAWIFDGGKDCRIRSNNCYGQVERRAQERELCLIGR